MNPDRRKFIRNLLAAAGVVGGWEAFAVLHRYGGDSLVKEAQAANLFISGHGGGGGGAASWDAWDEADEAGWGDSANTFIGFFENTSAGGNETGQGAGLAGADLVLTQINNVPGATGTPLYRQLTLGSVHHFTYTSGLFDGTMGGTNTWTVIMKVADIIDGATQLILDSGAPRNYLYKQADNTFKAYANGTHNAATTDTVPSSGIVYLCMWSDGTYIRSGFKTGTKPSKWSDFEANKRNSTTVDYAMPAWSSGLFYINNPSFPGTFKAYYIVLSKSCLIDNAS